MVHIYTCVKCANDLKEQYVSGNGSGEMFCPKCGATYNEIVLKLEDIETRTPIHLRAGYTHYSSL